MRAPLRIRRQDRALRASAELAPRPKDAPARRQLAPRLLPAVKSSKSSNDLEDFQVTCTRAAPEVRGATLNGREVPLRVALDTLALVCMQTRAAWARSRRSWARQIHGRTIKMSTGDDLGRHFGATLGALGKTLGRAKNRAFKVAHNSTTLQTPTGSGGAQTQRDTRWRPDGALCNNGRKLGRNWSGEW